MPLAAPLNTDICSHLLGFISSPRDLLAVGLSNTELFALVEPELVYRSLRCRLGHNTVWEHSIANPEKAARVRQLEIQRENPTGSGPLDEEERLPIKEVSTLRNNGSGNDKGELAAKEEIDKSERLLIQALRLMVNLESFIWFRWDPIINIGDIDVNEETNTYREDIWTTLRDFTQLKRMQVIDLGRHETIVEDVRPIFESSIFTLANLTHVYLKIYYSPVDPDEGSNAVSNQGGGNGDGGNGEDGTLLPGRVNPGRLKKLLCQCPNLQALSLGVIDRDFYTGYSGNPYTDVTTIFSDAHWEGLTSLELRDVIIDSRVMSSFLYRHPSLRKLRATLSLTAANLPAYPFLLDSQLTGQSSSNPAPDLFLPNLEMVYLHPEVLRTIASLVQYPWSIRSLAIVEPCDWGATTSDDEFDQHDFSALDEVWGQPGARGGPDEPGEPGATRKANFKFSKTPDLREIVISGLESLTQLVELAKVTPRLEALHIRNHRIKELNRFTTPHTLWMPCLSEWPRLKVLRGVQLWTSLQDGSDVNSVDNALEASSVLEEIKKACSNLDLGESMYRVK